MNRLYWRIFLAFWLVIIMTIVVTVTVGSISLRTEVADTRFAALSGSLDALAEQAQGRLLESGRPGLTAWLQDQQRASPLQHLLIIDTDGQDILGRPVPPRITRMVRFGGLADEKRRPRQFLSISRVLTGAGGARYVLLLPRRGPVAGRWFGSPLNRSIFPIVLVLISGVVCLLLARYLSRPIRAFRNAGQRIARGELGARVGSKLGGRKDEFGALARDFDHMAERIEQLIDGHQRLLRDVSHELRSPLARLNAAVALIRQRDGTEKLAPNLERIEVESEKLDGLIGRILGFARLEAQTAVAHEAVDLIEIIGGIVDDARFEAAACNAVVEFQSPGVLMAHADPVLIRSAIENVMRNAVQHCHHLISVVVVPDKDGTSARIRIIDDGNGLTSEADAERLFEPFFTSSSSAKGGGSGAGIGLAIARRALELHGGTIQAGNQPDGGFAVTIELPLGEWG